MRFHVKTDGTCLADLHILMNPHWKNDGEAFEDDLEDWERQIDEYERDSREIFPESCKRSILMHNSPNTVRKHLFLNASRMTTFQIVKAEVIQYLRSERTYGNATKQKTKKDDDPMEIDEVKGGKKGGKKGGQNGGKV